MSRMSTKNFNHFFKCMSISWWIWQHVQKCDTSTKSLNILFFHPCKNSTKIIIKFYTLQGEQCKKSHKIWTVFELVMNFLIWKKNKKCEKVVRYSTTNINSMSKTRNEDQKANSGKLFQHSSMLFAYSSSKSSMNKSSSNSTIHTPLERSLNTHHEYQPNFP